VKLTAEEQAMLKKSASAVQELVDVMKASLTIRIGSEEFQLEAEDAIYFDSAVLHSYRRRGPKPCTGLIVTVP